MDVVVRAPDVRFQEVVQGLSLRDQLIAARCGCVEGLTTFFGSRRGDDGIRARSTVRDALCKQQRRCQTREVIWRGLCTRNGCGEVAMGEKNWKRSSSRSGIV